MDSPTGKGLTFSSHLEKKIRRPGVGCALRHNSLYVEDGLIKRCEVFGWRCNIRYLTRREKLERLRLNGRHAHNELYREDERGSASLRLTTSVPFQPSAGRYLAQNLPLGIYIGSQNISGSYHLFGPARCLMINLPRQKSNFIHVTTTEAPADWMGQSTVNNKDLVFPFWNVGGVKWPFFFEHHRGCV